MENSKRISLSNLATYNIFLRYPRFDVQIIPDHMNNKGHIKFETFVSDTKSNLITYVEDNYQYPQPFEWNMLESVKSRFLDRCKMIEEKYIFNKQTAIEDPYEINRK